MLTYTPTTTATGYSNSFSVKANSRLMSNPDGTFSLRIWEGDPAKAPSRINIAICDYDKRVLWVDNLQNNVFKSSSKDIDILTFNWDNSHGVFGVGTIFVNTLVDNTAHTYEIVIQDSPFAAKCNSAFTPVQYAPSNSNSSAAPVSMTVENGALRVELPGGGVAYIPMVVGEPPAI